ncbi:MAG: hypothetical protein ACJAWV_002517 [Flammeovirgaceae bacterium]|jgi:hypothetical protein
MNQLAKNSLRQNGWLLFVLLCLVQLLFTTLNFEFVSTEEIYAEYLEEKDNANLESDTDYSEYEDDIDELEDENEDVFLEDLAFDTAFIVVDKLVSFTSITFCILVAFLLINKHKVSFGKIFKVVLIANFVFLLPVLVKLLWFSIQSDYSFEDIQYFYPLAAIQIFDAGTLPDWLVYLFKTLNLFELAYIFLLSLLLSVQLNISKSETLKYVLGGYGTGMIIWIGFRIYLKIAFG